MPLLNLCQESKTLLTSMGQRSSHKFCTCKSLQKYLEMELKENYGPRPQNFEEVLVGRQALQLGFDLDGANPNQG